MTAKIDKPTFSTARVIGLTCVFLSGIGTAGSMSYMLDKLEHAGALSCGTCRATNFNSTLDSTSRCMPAASTLEPLIVVATESAPLADTTIIEWHASSVSSLVWQASPDAWQRIHVRF